MIVRVWGVRGSFPQTSTKYQKYGGNTSCVSVELQDSFVVFDAGTGLSNFGYYWSEHGQGKPIHIFFGHSHMDHLLGLYNFKPFFNPEADIHLCGEQKFGMSFREQIMNIMQRCYWPTNPEKMAAQISFHNARAGEVFSPVPECNFHVTAIEGYHPGGALIYKLEAEEESVIYALDCELTDSAVSHIIPFAENADLIISDSNYDETEMDSCRGWGHSTVGLQIELSEKAGVRNTLFMHYAYNYDDNKLSEMEAKFMETGKAGVFARENMEIII